MRLERDEAVRVGGQAVLLSLAHLAGRVGSAVADDHDGPTASSPSTGDRFLLAMATIAVVGDGDGAALLPMMQHDALEGQEERQGHDERRDADAWRRAGR